MQKIEEELTEGEKRGIIKYSKQFGGEGMNDREKEKRTSRKEELDRFWEIDELISPRRAVPYACDTEATEVILEPIEEKEAHEQKIPPRPTDEPERHFIPPHSAQEILHAPRPEVEYEPDHALLHRVRLYRWKSDYRYYEQFVRDAVRLYAIHGEPCPRTPFFSYVPQYSQMNRQQLEWYLWWREQFRLGEYMDTDYSYLLLFAYELINLSTRMDPAPLRDALFQLWTHYRRTFYQLDSYLPEWICDLCLLHRLPPPELEEGKLLAAAMSHCTLKEFYVRGSGDDGYLRALMAFCSNYDYRKSKFCTAETAPLFDRVVFGALREVTVRTSEEGKLFSAANLEDSKMMRDAYTGALCSPRVKRRIEVEYCSFSRSHELRFLVTDIIKYTENQIRASIGVRSRLSIYALPIPIREVLDAYLPTVLPKRTRAAASVSSEPPAYEKLYDTPRRPLSFAAAQEIERASWETTERLVDAFEEETEVSAVSESAPPTKQEETADGTPVSDVARYQPFLRAVLREDTDGQRAEAGRAGLMLEAFADEINAWSADLMGDILLEESGTAFAVLEDYREWLEELLTDAEEKEI